MPRRALNAELTRRLLRARDHMDAASHEDWPVTRLARISGVSPAHFSRSFKLAFGIPPHRHLLTRRIERAKALLRDTDLPVTEVAFATGWKSLGTFSRTFRDVTDETPTAFRDRMACEATDTSAIPACVLAWVTRPTLKTAVSEKRRTLPAPKNPAKPPEE